MIVVLSPAKSLDLSLDGLPAWLSSLTTTPKFQSEAMPLVSLLQKLSHAQLKSLLSVSDDLAKLNVERYKQFHADETPEKAAALAFDGPAYQHLKASELKKDEATWAQDHVRILSGLFGLLRPLDLIRPYRLDMSKKLKNPRGANLYSYWSEIVTNAINSELDLPIHEGSRFLVNAASSEYYKVIDEKKLKYPVVHCMFPGAASVHAKQARGAMVRHIVVNKAETIDQLKTFAGNDGEFKLSSSSEDKKRLGTMSLTFKRTEKQVRERGKEEQGEEEGKGRKKQKK
jgi:cytoplasmic iron level regulating protein YaaA (DUF328/UPF0246 family)